LELDNGNNSSSNEPIGKRGGSPSNLAANSNKNNFFHIILTTWKVAKTIAHQKLIFKVKKPVEAPI
jgi:hypothetical protein